MDLDTSGINSVTVVSATSLFSHPVSYRIPYFQRQYCWTQDEQWEPLWRDITKTAERYQSGDRKPRAHFMGAMVTQQQSSKPGVVQTSLVIDGQQRLATLQVVIKATADVVGSQGLQEMANRLNILTRNDDNYSDQDPENIVKVRQTDPRDRIAFAGIMQGKDDDGTSGSDIGKCYRYFHKKIVDWLAENPRQQWRSAGSTGSRALPTAVDCRDRSARRRGAVHNLRHAQRPWRETRTCRHHKKIC